MMNPIVEENLISFKELEQKIFAYVCELGREITRIMLESYDRELAEGRDKKAYRGKGSRRTTIKTVYGEVEYRRRVYRTETEDGQSAHVFLLDQAMDKFTVEEINLMCVFEGQDRKSMIADIKNVIPHIQDSDMVELARQVLGKLEAMSDEEFAEVAMEAAE